MKILLIVPLYPKAPFVSERTIASIEAQDWPHKDTVTVEPMKSTPGALHYVDLMDKHNRARQMALDGGYDAMWSVEADMVLPPDALTKLWAVDADVVYGLYCARRAGMWLLFPTTDGLVGTSIVADKLEARRAWGRVVKSEGAGFGCTLIRRNVLEAIEFRRPETSAFADDWFHAMDCKEAGFRQAHHCGVICGHIVDDTKTFWPDIDAPNLCRVEMTVDEGGIMDSTRSEQTYLVLRALDNGRGDITMPGAIVKLPHSMADILLARRAIELMPDQDVEPEPDHAEQEQAAVERTTRKSRRKKSVDIEPEQADKEQA